MIWDGDSEFKGTLHDLLEATSKFQPSAKNLKIAHEKVLDLINKDQIFITRWGWTLNNEPKVKLDKCSYFFNINDQYKVLTTDNEATASYYECTRILDRELSSSSIIDLFKARDIVCGTKKPNLYAPQDPEFLIEPNPFEFVSGLIGSSELIKNKKKAYEKPIT